MCVLKVGIEFAVTISFTLAGMIRSVGHTNIKYIGGYDASNKRS